MNIKDRIEKVKDESTDDFEFEIKDVFNLTGRGTVVVGDIKSGVYMLGDSVYIKTTDGKVWEDIVTCIWGHGDFVSIDLKKSRKEDLKAGDKIVRKL
ncbi:hypothetical protein [Sebaldella sp. S0638]|uniref:hypothetical protein n=1 Tax=Sebaldella sp. S0638 TaxID=2957809 RepID=UPI00209F3849|nr:hypothetical protein [Sebaldella sp. S0638]MCP1224643.1 hypothetical protein [Sebaldella sp. S0638]